MDAEFNGKRVFIKNDEGKYLTRTRINGGNSFTDNKKLAYTYVDFFHKTGLYIDAISRRMAPHWWMPSNVGHEFIEGHCGQELKSKQTASRSIKFFKPVANDHFGDCTKGHRVIREVRRQYYAMGLT